MEIKGGNYVSQIKRLSDRILEQILAVSNLSREFSPKKNIF